MLQRARKPPAGFGQFLLVAALKNADRQKEGVVSADNGLIGGHLLGDLSGTYWLLAGSIAAQNTHHLVIGIARKLEPGLCHRCPLVLDFECQSLTLSAPGRSSMGFGYRPSARIQRSRDCRAAALASSAAPESRTSIIVLLIAWHSCSRTT